MEFKNIIAVALSGSLLLGGSLTLAKDKEGVNDPARENVPPNGLGIQERQEKKGVEGQEEGKHKGQQKTKKVKKAKKTKKKKAIKKATPDY